MEGLPCARYRAGLWGPWHGWLGCRGEKREEAATETILTTWVISALEGSTKCSGSSEQRAIRSSPAGRVWKTARGGAVLARFGGL